MADRTIRIGNVSSVDYGSGMIKVTMPMSSVLKNWKRTRSRCSIFMRNWCMVAGKNGIKQIN